MILDCDKYIVQYRHTDELCDYIIYDSCQSDNVSVNVAILELKSGEVDSKDWEKAVAQLRKGANLACNLGKGANIVQVACFLAKGGINSFVTRQRKIHPNKYLVTFPGFGSLTIRTVNCGHKLYV